MSNSSATLLRRPYILDESSRNKFDTQLGDGSPSRQDLQRRLSAECSDDDEKVALYYWLVAEKLVHCSGVFRDLRNLVKQQNRHVLIRSSTVRNARVKKDRQAKRGQIAS